MSAPPDYTGNPQAKHDRTVKATALARWALATRHDLAVIVDPKQRRQIEREAGVRRCSDETWAEAVRRYDRARDEGGTAPA